MLDIQLLGRFHLTVAGNPVDIRSRPARLLLAYLALNAGVPQPRSKVAGVLWPDSSESNARSNLRQALWRLRKALGDEHFQVDKTSIAFTPRDPWRLDVAVLEGEGESLESLLEQVGAYAGELLPGVYADWVARERSRLETVFEDRIALLLEKLLKARRWREAREWAERWIAMGGVPEAAYRALMLAYAAEGEVSGVAEAYRRCQEDLERELAVEPSPGTHRLFQRLTEGGDPASLLLDELGAPSPTPETWSQEPSSLPVHRGSEGQRKPFVGREAELDRLMGVLERAFQGQPQIVFITGGPGRGKTALALEFARRAQLEVPDLLVAFGACNAYTGLGDPYLPFRDLLAMLTGDTAAGGLGAGPHAVPLWTRLPATLQTLLNLGPSLVGTFVESRLLLFRARKRGVPPGVLRDLEAIEHTADKGLGSVEQTRAFEQYAAFLRALSAQTPLVVILDDLQWIDRASASLFFHLVRRLQGARVVLVGTYRQEELAAGSEGEPHPLEKALLEIRLKFDAIEVDLGSLAKDSSREFVDELLNLEPNTLGPEFREALLHHTQGHPLFTVELLKALEERGDLQRDAQGRLSAPGPIDWDLLPARVEAVIEARAARLASAHAKYLQAASVEGEVFTAQVLAQVLDEPEADLLHTLTAVLERRHRLVHEAGESQAGDRLLTHFRFRHHLFQRYFYDSLGSGERRLLHRKVAEALEDLYREDGQEVAVRLARHYREAGDHQKAVTYLDLAGRRATALHAHLEALGHWDQALALLPPEDTRVPEIQRRRAETLLQLFRGQEALPDLEALLTHARQTGDKARELEALLHLGRAHYIAALDAPDRNHADQGASHYEQALDLAQELGDRRAMVRALLSAPWLEIFFPDRAQEARSHARRAVEIASDLGDEDLLLDSRLTAISIGSAAPHLAEAEDLLRLLQQREDLTRQNNLLFNLMGAHLVAGNFHRAVECADLGMTVAEQIGVPPVQYATYKAVALTNLGRMDAAREALDQEIADEDHPFGKAFRDAGLATYLWALRAHDPGQEVSRRILVQATELGRAWLASVGRAFLALAWLEQGQHPGSEAFQRLLQDLETDSDYPKAIYALGEAARLSGDLETAVQRSRQVRQVAEDGGRLSEVPWGWLLEARALLDMGEAEQALAAAEAGLRLAREMAYRPLLWQLLAAQGESLRRLDRGSEAENAYREAVQIIRQMADRAGDKGLRAAFLQDPAVRRVLEAAGESGKVRAP